MDLGMFFGGFAAGLVGSQTGRANIFEKESFSQQFLADTRMTYKSFSSSLLIGLVLFLDFCGVTLSDKDILLKGPENGWFTNSGPVSSQIGSWYVYQANQYSVCDTSTTDREPTNWLRTDFIDVKDAIRVDIIVNYTVRKCKPGKIYCKEYFKLYGYQTSTTTPKPNPLQTQFDFLAKAKPTTIPDRQTGPEDFNIMKVSIKARDKGLYLAFYDQGACLSLLKILVSFNFCPEKGKNLVTYVRTVAPFNDSSANQIEGKCTDRHSKNTTELTAACMSKGNWNMNNTVRCLCQPGYEYSEKPDPHCTGCGLGKYKSEMSNTLCQSCPRNSAPDTQRKDCVCSLGYYRLNKHPSSVACEALPDGPLFANASTWNTTSILVSWPPVTNINGSFSYSIDCYKCKDNEDKICVEQCGKDTIYYPRKDGFKTIAVAVSGLPSGTRFKFKVYVETDINAAADRKEWKFAKVYGNTKEGPEEPNPEDGSKALTKLALTVGVPVIAFLILIIVICAVLIYCRRSRKFRRVPNTDEIHELPTCGQKVYIDPTNYDNPEDALRNFAKELDKCSITLEKVIGGGEFGDVYKGILRRHNEDPVAVAVKTLKQGSSKKNRDDFILEASVMGQFCDPNVIYLEGVVTKSHPLMIVTEFMSNGSLDNFLKEMDSKLSVLQMLGMARGVASGMKFLSEMNYVHRDLAARNILVSESLVCKVADFGLSRELEDSAYETKGGKIPVRWTAPEAIKYRKFSTSSDVWSYGILLWEIMSFAERPYWDWSNFEVMDRVEGGFRLPPPMQCPKAVHQIMIECWNADRTKRPKFADIVKLLDILIRSPEKMKENIPIEPTKPTIDYTAITTIDEWLNSIKMGQYTDQFVMAGYSNLKNLAEFEEPDLEEMGIKLIGHKNKIRKSIREVKTKLKRESSVPV